MSQLTLIYSDYVLPAEFVIISIIIINININEHSRERVLFT